MPQIPTYGDRRVNEAPLRGGYQQPTNEGRDLQALGRGVADAAETGHRIILMEEETKAEDVSRQMTTEWLKWKGENETKYRGATANEFVPAAEAWWKEAQQKYGQELSPYGKNLIARRMGERAVIAVENVRAHATAEFERHADDVAQASIENTREFAVRTGAIQAGADQIRQQISAFGARKGWDGEQVEAQTRKQLTPLYAGHVETLADTDIGAARRYLDENREHIESEMAQRLDDLIDRKQKEGEAQYLASSFTSAASVALAGQPLTNADDIIDVPAAIEQGRAALRAQGVTLDAQQEEQFENYVRSQANKAEQDARRAEAVRLGQTYDLIDQAGGDIYAVAATNPDALSGFSRKAQDDLRGYAERKVNGLDIPDDPVVVTTLSDPATLKAANLDEFRNRLNGKTYALMKEQQDKLLREPLAEASMQSDKTAVDAMLPENIRTDPVEYGRFVERFNYEVNVALRDPANKTGTVTQEQKKDIAAKLLEQRVIEKTRVLGVPIPFTGGTSRAYEIPEADREAIIEALGGEPTEFEIQRVWRARQQLGGGQ